MVQPLRRIVDQTGGGLILIFLKKINLSYCISTKCLLTLQVSNAKNYELS